MINLSGGNLAIGISLLMRDGFSGPASTATVSMSRMERQMHSLARSQVVMARNSSLMGAAIGVGVISKMGSWVKEGARYGYMMKYVSSLTNSTHKEIKALDDRAKSLGQTTMFSSKDIASGMRYMAMAGMTSKQILNNIGAATNLSIAGLVQLGGKGGGADILTNIMKGFQIPADMATRTADILTTAATSANISVYDLGESMKYAASTSMDLKIGLEEASTMAMMAGNAGIQGTMAGTAIENMLRYITMATGGDRPKADKALALLNLNRSDLVNSKGDLKSIGALLHTIGAAGERMKLTNVSMQNIYKTLFGVRGKRAGSLLLRNIQEYDKFLNQLNVKSQGSAARIAKGQLDTPFGRMKQWSDTLVNLKIAFEEAIQPVLIPFLRALTLIIKGLNKFMSLGFGRFLTILGAGWVIAKTASLLYKSAIYSIMLVTGNLGRTTISTANATVTGYSRMTAAAAAYNTTVRAGMMGAGQAYMAAGGRPRFGGGVMMSKNGRPYVVKRGQGGRFITAREAANRKVFGGRIGGWMSKKRTPRGFGSLGKIGKYGFGAGMIASIGLGAASNYVGNASVGGKVLQGASDAANYGMMGATIGSIIPGIGTAVGAVIGAAGGILWNVYDNITSAEEEINNQKAKADANIFQSDTWKEKAKIFLDLKPGEKYFNGIDNNNSPDKILTDIKKGKKKQNEITNFITIYLDGEKVMAKGIKSNNNEVEFKLGID